MEREASGQGHRISRALSIDGFMEPAELQWLAERAREYQVIVELGSYLGRSTRALGDNAVGTVYAIDDWQGPRAPGLTYDDSPDQYGQFCANLFDLIEAGKVIPVRSDHASASVPVTPDMVFLDGDHEPETIRRDAPKWKSILTNGGLLCGHDWSWPGMMETLWDLFGYVHVVQNTQIWWINVRKHEI